MASIEINGYRAGVEQFGSGAPVVLVHGLGGSGTQTWKGVIGPLSATHRVVVYDLRGAGESEVTPGPYTIDLLADDLAALIHDLELAPASLVGHSMGGSTVLSCAARYPQLVRAVVAVGAAVGLTSEQRSMLAGWAEKAETEGLAELAEAMSANGVAPSFRESHPQTVEELRALIASTKPDGYAALVRAVSTISLENRLAEIAAPVLFVAGEHDMISTPSLNRQWAQVVGQATVVEIAGSGHHIEVENAGALVEAVTGFLASAVASTVPA